MKELIKKDLLRCLEQSHDGFMVSDSRGIILYSNEAYRRLTKLYERGGCGTDLKELVGAGEIDSSTCMQAISHRDMVSSVHLDYEHDGVILSASKPIFSEDGTIEYVINNVRDTSEFFNLKHDLEEARAAIDAIASHVVSEDNIESRIVAVSPKMQETLSIAKRASAFNVAVLIQGESGTGKEVVAQYIHDHSPRKKEAFIAVNCGAIPDNLIETELFGYAEGTFTGQTRGGKQGLLDAARGGTVFLDEIGDMPLPMQVKLLRVLETNTFRPVGCTKDHELDARFIYATNKDLKKMVEEGTFRDDLYYRMNVISIELSPLRERKEDIIPMALFFLEQFNQKYRLRKTMPPDIFSGLQNYRWPGNVRELKNTIETMTVMSSGSLLELPERICDNVRTDTFKLTADANVQVGDLNAFIERQEKAYLIYCYEKCGTTRKMAEELNVNHSTIMRKLKKYDIKANK